MKYAIKRSLPKPVVKLIDTILRNLKRRKYPRRSRYQGDNHSVLQCRIAYNKFGGYCVPLSSLHRPAAQKILSGGVWESQTIEFISRNCGDKDIVHAGAYFGDFIPALSGACDHNARVFAFEPNPENHRCASMTIFLNGLYNVELRNAALGSDNGWHSMMILDKKGRSLGGDSRLVEIENEDNHQQYTQVETIKLDDAIPPDRNIGILQLDVEEFEQSALAGAMTTIKRCKPILILENLPDAGWLKENILSLGYEIVGTVNANTILQIGKSTILHAT